MNETPSEPAGILELRDGASGVLEGGQLVRLLELAVASRKPAVLRVDLGPRSGEIQVNDGDICWAQVGDLQGSAAILRMCAWDGAVYRIALRPFAVRRRMAYRTEALISNAREHARALGEQAGALGGLRAVWAPKFDALRSALGSMGPADQMILRLFDGRRMLQEVIADGAWDDAECVKNVTRLRDLGVIAPAPSDAQQKRAASDELRKWLGGPNGDPKWLPPGRRGAHAETSSAPPDADDDDKPMPKPKRRTKKK